jgi:hypothetical protein
MWLLSYFYSRRMRPYILVGQVVCLSALSLLALSGCGQATSTRAAATTRRPDHVTCPAGKTAIDIPKRQPVCIGRRHAAAEVERVFKCPTRFRLRVDLQRHALVCSASVTFHG